MSTSIACHWLLSTKSALLFPILLLVWAHVLVGTHATSLESVERESTLGGMCFDSTVSDQPALRNLRRQIVKYNQRKSMYRDGDIIAVYKLDRPGHGSLAGCADACLLNWRLTDDTRQALDTDCSLDINSHCPMTSGILVADRKCEAFMFNRLTSVCTLLSARQSLRLTRSSNFWSGKLICEDMSSVDDWAEGVVSRRSPPPPPSPPPPSPPPPPPSPPPPPPSPPPPSPSPSPPPPACTTSSTSPTTDWVLSCGTTDCVSTCNGVSKTCNLAGIQAVDSEAKAKFVLNLFGNYPVFSTNPGAYTDGLGILYTPPSTSTLYWNGAGAIKCTGASVSGFMRMCCCGNSCPSS